MSHPARTMDDDVEHGSLRGRIAVGLALAVALVIGSWWFSRLISGGAGVFGGHKATVSGPGAALAAWRQQILLNPPHPECSAEDLAMNRAEALVARGLKISVEELRRRCREGAERARDGIQSAIVPVPWEDFANLGTAELVERKLPEALEFLGQALEAIDRIQNPDEWAELQMVLARAHRASGAGIGPGVTLHLAAAEAACRASLEWYVPEKWRPEAASIYDTLGTVLLDGARSLDGVAGLQRMEDALKAYRQAMQLRFRDEPFSWAATQLHLASGLNEIVRDTEGPEALSLLQEAVRGCREALEVLSRADFPAEWALLHHRLASVLMELSGRSLGPESVAMAGEAAGSCRLALEVWARDGFATEWAMAHNTLGRALADQAARAEPDDFVQLAADSVRAYRAALEVWTRERWPLEWAEVQDHLGDAYVLQSGHASTPVEAMEKLTAAAAAYRTAMEVVPAETQPRRRAFIGMRLAAALNELSATLKGSDRLRCLREALSAWRLAVETLDPQVDANQWARAQTGLSLASTAAASLVGDGEAAKLLANSVRAFRAVAASTSREKRPLDWAVAEGKLGDSLRELARLSSDSEARRLLSEAIGAYSAALQVFSREQHPLKWSALQNSLGNALTEQAAAATAAAAPTLLMESIRAYQLSLQVRTRTSQPLDWAATQNNLGTALRDLAGRRQGEVSVRGYQEAIQAYQAALEVLTQDKVGEQHGVVSRNLQDTEAELARRQSP